MWHQEDYQELVKQDMVKDKEEEPHHKVTDILLWMVDKMLVEKVGQ